MPAVGDALVEVRSEDYETLKQTLLAYEKAWENTERRQDMKDKASQISKQLEASQKLLEEKPVPQKKLYDSIVSLARSTDDYLNAASKSDTSVDKESVLGLIKSLDQIQAQIEQDHFSKAQTLNQSFVKEWTALEKPIRETNVGAYGTIETKMSMVRVALNKTPVQKQQAADAVSELRQTIQDYTDGKLDNNAKTNKEVSLTGLIDTLGQVETSIGNQQYDQAAAQMEDFIQFWPQVEGKVLTKSQSTYNQTENTMTKVLTILSSQNPDDSEAIELIREMRSDLEPYAEESSYSAWDAFFILFREGMEAILIIATLLAYLRRTGNHNKQVWVWSGLGIGLLLSAGLAVVLTLAFAGMQAGTNREMIEGITGIIAVIMMITVGAWLHKQSNVLAWNQYVNQQLQKVMKTGASWMLALVTFVAIFREGAETILFYLGMAPSIKLSSLLAGMGGALLVLLIIGFLLIKLSVRIPIRPFFLAASLLIYFIALKFTGVSIHALQITDLLPVHPLTTIGSIDLIGFYPTWETALGQLILLIIIVSQFLRSQRRKRQSKSELAS
ncbi:FTR1 family protein [Halobacillus salinarum]|uniref:FTR1 family protein n=1 Tax=Halobacillus salinarum TaxID=2932257 RepID=A0ABY4ENY2_9BACI|nr:FTR1 family protein [Halobacillus salinarum]UOQ43811.1 FTR1 family protein [Halobacillus salinarum]